MSPQSKCPKINTVLKLLPLIATILLSLCGLAAITQGLLWPMQNFDSFTCSAAFFAASAITYQGYRNNISDSQSTSRFYLEKYKETSETIVNYLKSDKPTRRVCWVTAAKITEMLVPLEEKITSLADKELLKIYQRYLAHDLYEFISTKSPMYFTGRENTSSYELALERPKVIATPGLIPKPIHLDHVTESSIKTLLDLMNLLWEDEAGYKYSNEEEFNNVIRLNYPNVAEYLSELKKYK
jgi:hypothetical protein